MTLAAHHPESAGGEICAMILFAPNGHELDGVPQRCGKPAKHKVAEEIDTDWPTVARNILDGNIEVNVRLTRHELTAYLCCECFARVMGPVAAGWCQTQLPTVLDS